MSRKPNPMQLVKDASGWWITGADPYMVDNDGPFTSLGPYATKAEAIEARTAVANFFSLESAATECKPETEVTPPSKPETKTTTPDSPAPSLVQRLMFSM